MKIAFRIEKGWHRGLLVLCLFTVLGGAVYWNSLGNSFQYDDQIYVLGNRNIQTIKNIPYFFVKPRMIAANPYQAGHYRPLVATSYAINYAIGGLDTTGYHAFNLAFHVGSAFLIFLMVQAMLISGQRSAVSSQQETDKSPYSSLLTAHYFSALAAGVIFLVHPFNSEAVNYITARSSVMSGFFYLLGFYCWVRFRQLAVSGEQLAVNSEQLAVRRKRETDKSAHCSLLTANYFYIASLLAFVAGMLSKEMGITLPVVLWLYDLYFYRSEAEPAALKERPEGLSLRQHRPLLRWRTYLSYLPFVLIVVIPYLIVRASSYGGVFPRFKRDLLTQLFTELPVLVKHLRMFLIPAPLTPVHYVDIQQTFWSLSVVFSALILIIYAAVAVFLFRTSSRAWRVVSFFMIWFFIVLLPITIIPLNAIFQENRGYLAIVSFAAFAGIGLGEIKRIRMKGAAVIVLLLLIAVYSMAVVQRNRVWSDELTLWSDTVRKVPNSPIAHTALAVAYRKLKLYDKAIEASRRALALGGEENFILHANLGKVYIAQENWVLAAEELERAIKVYPYYASVHYDLGRVYFNMERLDLAEKRFHEAIRLDPKDYQSYFYLGGIYTKEERLDDAISAYQKALSLSPEKQNLRLRLLMGAILEEAGRKGEAADAYRSVVKQGGGEDKIAALEAIKRLARIEKEIGREEGRGREN